MKKIGLFLGVAPHAGGMFQYAQSLLAALTALPTDKYSVHVLCAGDEWRPLLAESRCKISVSNYGRVGIRLSEILMALRLPSNLTWALSRFNPLARELRRLGCDAWIFPAQDAISYQADVPAIVTIHDLMHRYEPHFPEVSSKSRFVIREHRFGHISASALAILVDSEVGKQHVIESYGARAEKIHPLPYIAPHYIQSAKESADFEARYALPKKFLFYPAQFWAHKNHRRLIEAAHSVRAECPDMHLVFTGGRRYAYDDIHAYAQSLGMLERITFCGYVPDADLPGFYRRARALVMPTFFGPTNIPPLEALACNCPVAMSGIYAMPEQLGDAALYFDPTSVDDIAQTIQRLWLDDALCGTLQEQGRKRLALWGQAQFDARLQTILDITLT